MRVLLLAVALLSPLERLDVAVQEAVQASRAPWLEPVMKGASNVGRPANVLGVLLAIALLDAAAGPATVRLALLAVAPTNLVVEGMKRTVNRTRPDGEHKRSNASFPSSHAANAAAIAWIFSRRWRRLAPAFWALALTVAWSRVYLNRHYLSDVVVGLAIGMACAWLAPRLMRRFAKARPAPSGPAPEPG
jgi:undecaprenyl-diphosphatase